MWLQRQTPGTAWSMAFLPRVQTLPTLCGEIAAELLLAAAAAAAVVVVGVIAVAAAGVASAVGRVAGALAARPATKPEW